MVVVSYAFSFSFFSGFWCSVFKVENGSFFNRFGDRGEVSRECFGYFSFLTCKCVTVSQLIEFCD